MEMENGNGGNKNARRKSTESGFGSNRTLPLSCCWSHLELCCGSDQTLCSSEFWTSQHIESRCFTVRSRPEPYLCFRSLGHAWSRWGLQGSSGPPDSAVFFLARIKRHLCTPPLQNCHRVQKPLRVLLLRFVPVCCRTQDSQRPLRTGV